MPTTKHFNNNAIIRIPGQGRGRPVSVLTPSGLSAKQRMYNTSGLSAKQRMYNTATLKVQKLRLVSKVPSAPWISSNRPPN